MPVSLRATWSRPAIGSANMCPELTTQIWPKSRRAKWKNEAAGSGTLSCRICDETETARRGRLNEAMGMSRHTWFTCILVARGGNARLLHRGARCAQGGARKRATIATSSMLVRLVYRIAREKLAKGKPYGEPREIPVGGARVGIVAADGHSGERAVWLFARRSWTTSEGERRKREITDVEGGSRSRNYLQRNLNPC